MSVAEQKKKLLALCGKIRNNDPSVKALELHTLGKIEVGEANAFAEALDSNTHVRDLYILLGENNMAPPGSLLFSHYLRKSTRLRKFGLWGAGDSAHDSGATPVLLKASSQSKSLISLSLSGNFSDKPEVLEKLLAETRGSLKHLIFSHQGVASAEVAHALRRGFCQNQSLHEVTWNVWNGPHLEEALVGLFDMPKLKKLTIKCTLTSEASQVLRCLLKCNKTLEKFEALQVSTPVLRGLMDSRSLTDVGISPTAGCDPLALAEMLRRNKTIQTLKLTSGTRLLGRCYANAIALGLCHNTSLKSLVLQEGLSIDALHGPTWQEMLQRNTSLTTLNLGRCRINFTYQSDFFQHFNLGLSQNSTLKMLALPETKIRSDHASGLAEALLDNVSLKRISMQRCGVERSEGAVLVAKFWRNSNLELLNFTRNRFGGGVGDETVFSEGLPNNDALVTLKLRACALNPPDCRIIVDSLRGNKALQFLDLGNNKISLDGSCATALKEFLKHSRIRVFHFEGNTVTSEGMTNLASGLNLNKTLTELHLDNCRLDTDGLLVLAESLVANCTLETLHLRRNAFDKDGLCEFFELLPKMKGLQNLYLDAALFDESVGLKLTEGLKGNFSLQKIDSVSQSELAPKVKDSIEFYLKMNRNGRRFLQESKPGDVRVEVPIGTWPLILAKMTSPSERDELFHFLRNKGDLVQSTCIPSRKRKASDALVSSD